MGNCVLKGMNSMSGHGGISSGENMVKVVTSNGGIMELYTPITVDFITREFPGHAIFHSRHREFFSSSEELEPLLHNEELHAGELYYLLPLINNTSINNNKKISMGSEAADIVFPRHGGVWKVRLVISPEQLAQILSEASLTEALIESLRTVAKCTNGGGRD